MSRHPIRRSLVLACSLALPALLAGHAAQAAPQVTLPHTFQPNTPAKAAEVNDDLNALKNAINALQTTVAAQQTTIAALQSQLSSMGNVAALNNVVELVQVSHTDGAGNTAVYPTVQFHGVNVQIVNGMGSTDTTNGLGNLIIGYNESNLNNETAFCSDGYYADANTCHTHGIWASDQRSGSHNLILGRWNAYTQYDGIVTGFGGIISGFDASVLAGYFDTASGDYSAVISGGYNTASGVGAHVGGGYINRASGARASVSGGQQNTATGDFSSVSGGVQNIANSDAASVSGGWLNTAGNVGQTSTTWIGGGESNSATGANSVVCGGASGSATGTDQVICP